MQNSFLLPQRSFRLVFLLALVAAIGTIGCNTSTEPERADNEGSTWQAPPDSVLKAKLDRALEIAANRRLNSATNNAWQVVHGCLAFGHDLKIEHNGQLIPCLDWILTGGDLKGWNMVPGDKGLESVVESGKVGPGHEDQWLGYLSQVGLTPDQPIVVKGTTWHIQDVINQAQWDCREGMEATWTLMSMATYESLDATWKARDGQPWNVARLLKMETAQDLSGSACGGTHRMYGIAVAVNRYLEENGNKVPPGSEWEAADNKIKECIANARKYQQPNGAFSTNYFSRSGTSPDLQIQLNSTGHMFEFLTLAMSPDQIKEPWFVHSAVYLCDLFERTKDLSLECGGLYHAAHGLQLYRLRRFGPQESTKSEPESATGPAKEASSAPPAAEVTPDLTKHESADEAKKE